jgi:hypothetical protein
MKHSDSTEMDRLLRRHARRGGETLFARRGASDDAAAGAAGSGAHLDADEMNAYAEGALPEAARSRYFSHLADCETCRKLVTDLTLAASLADEGKARVASLAAAPPSKSWREWLAAIFSPPVLRYGVPALALFAVITIVIVAMMNQKKESSVAQNQAGDSARSTATAPNSAVETQTTTGTAENHSNSNAAPLMDQQSTAQPDTAATPPAKPTPMESDAPIVPQEGIASSTTPAQTAVTENKGREFGVAGKREQAEAAPAPPPPAPQVLSAPAATTQGNRDKQEEPKKAKAAGKDDTDEMVVDGTTAGGAVADRAESNEDRQDVGRTAASRAPANQPRSRRPSTAMKSGPAAGTAREKESFVETRSVGGRRFRKQGGAWIDTAYSSSRPTTNVARGSEQYRALIADEPGLRPIAEQLGGEVYVVWKSRAYRFY